MAEENKFSQVIWARYQTLVNEFCNICKKQMEKRPNEIPEAMNKLHEIIEYENFFKKFFDIKLGN